MLDSVRVTQQTTAVASRKKKAAERDALLADDAFLEKGSAWQDWLESNVKFLLAGLAVVLFGVWFFQNKTAGDARVQAEVTAELTKAIEKYSEATDLRAVLTSTSPAALNKKYGEAKEMFSAIRRKHDTGPAPRLAAVYEGELARRLGDDEEAVKLFDAYIKEANDADPLLFVALEGRASALESKGDLDAAAAAYDVLAKRQPFYEDVALKGKARVLHGKGDTQGAVAAYQSIVDKDPESPFKAFAEERIKALK